FVAPAVRRGFLLLNSNERFDYFDAAHSKFLAMDRCHAREHRVARCGEREVNVSPITGARLPRHKFSRDKLGYEADGRVVLYLHPLAQFPDRKPDRAPKTF